MKRILRGPWWSTGIMAIFIAALGVALSSCEALETLGLSEKEIVQGLTKALEVGAKDAVKVAMGPNGYLGNKLTEIPLPEPVQQFADFLSGKENTRGWQDAILRVASEALKGATADLLKSMNLAAQDAASEAGPIFLEAIKGMTIQDGMGILQGGEHAATDFLQANTQSKLTALYAPKVNSALDKGDVSKYWKNVVSYYNQYAPTAKQLGYTGDEHIDPDLGKYVTGKALDGLFKLVGVEESKIRKDPKGYAESIIEKVFSSPEAKKALGK